MGISQNTRVKHVNATTTFNTPIHARQNGQPVRILAVGDSPESSPVYLAVDSDGYTGWSPISEFQITDTNCLPLGADSLSSMGRDLSREPARSR